MVFGLGWKSGDRDYVVWINLISCLIIFKKKKGINLEKKKRWKKQSKTDETQPKNNK